MVPRLERGSCYNCGDAIKGIPYWKSEQASSRIVYTVAQDPGLVYLVEPDVVLLRYITVDQLNNECGYSINAIVNSGSPISLL